VTTYEELVEHIAALVVPADPAQRDIHWATDRKVVGVSKTGANRTEIFLAGPQLGPVSHALREVVDFQSWWRNRAGDPAFEANRIVLPEAGHFDRVAAFLCVELLRNGADEDLALAFARTEPILELTLERLRPSDQSLLGLLGEMLFLAAACEAADDSHVAYVVGGWDGWRPSLRDFSWGRIGVEAKTTTGPTSTHSVQGTHQVEPDTDNGEDLLFLLSVGLRPIDPHPNTVTLPGLVDRILSRLTAAGVEPDTFLVRLREYGATVGFGYDHTTMREDPAFTEAFEVGFVRAYDMTDENVSVIRSDDVAEHQHVNPRSLRFTVQLPVTVSGDINPIVGLNQAAAAILGA
jgi:hypothetical protein